jgi:ribosomal protein S17
MAKKERIGIVVSNKAEKTIIESENCYRQYLHPLRND